MTRPEDSFDFRNPDYGPIFKARVERLARIRENPDMLPGLFAYYRENPWDFISDWGMTYAPKANDGQPIVRPMVLFPKQVEWLKWVVHLWKTQQRGLTEKSRESGVTWLAVELGATLCLFYDDLTVGYGANLVELVDNLGDMDSILEKGRFFLDNLPPEFTGGWHSGDSQYSKEKLLRFPLTSSRMKGQGGDNIGRGGRASLYFVDEFAHIQRAKGVDQALSANTDTQIDISTVKGLANAFAEKRHSGRVPVFTFHWRDDPRKDEAWYAKQLAQFDPVLVAQEIDINYSASVEGVLIPSEWVQSAVNADRKLGFTITGAKRAALDVADEGKDKNALCIGQGIAVEQVPEWSGKGSDILGTVQKAFGYCDDAEVADMQFDSDGLGAGVRGDARMLNEIRTNADNPAPAIKVSAWRGSGAVANPTKPIPTANPTPRKDRLNGDYFANAKAQGWWELRTRFQRTHRAVTEPDYKYDPDDLIVLREGLGGLYSELSQPTYTVNTAGKIIVDKAPDGTPSPNKADSVMIYYAPRQGGAYEMNL